MAGNDHGDMDWMYKGPSSLVNREDYLLGRKVDKSFQMLEASEKGSSSWMSEAEKDLTPQSILKPSSGPVDVIRKVKDDPLYQIQKKEQDYRKQLLQNPILLKKLQQKHATATESSNKPMKKSKKSKKTKHKKKHKKRKSSSSSESDSSSDTSDEDVKAIFNRIVKKNKTEIGSDRAGSSRQHRDRSRSHSVEDKPKPKLTSSDRLRNRSRSPPRHEANYKYRRSSPSSSRKSRYDEERRYESGRSKPKLDESEMERRRQQMMGFAKQRDEERERVVQKHRDSLKKEQEMLEKHRQGEMDSNFIRKQLSEAASTGSVEQRVKSNAYNIQRSKSAMNENFARR